MKLKKIVKSFLTSSSEARYEDVEYVLRAFSFKEISSKGSHHTFRHEDGRQQIVAKMGGQKVKRYIVKQIIKLLSLEDWYVQEEEN